MTFSLFLQRIATILAAFGFAGLFLAIMKADDALIGNGLLALLPVGLVIILLVRIARQSARVAPKAD